MIQSVNSKKADLPKLDNYYYPPVISYTKQGERVSVATYIHCKLDYTLISSPAVTQNSGKRLFSSAVEISLGGLPLGIVNCYYPSGTDEGGTGWINLLPPTRRWLVLGDFNEHHPLWSADRCVGGGLSNSSKHLADIIVSSDLAVLNDGSITRIADRGDQRSGAVDLSLASSTLYPLCEWRTHHNTLGSDHLPVLITVHARPELVEPPPREVKYQLYKANWELFGSILDSLAGDINISDSLVSQEELEHTYQVIRRAILNAADAAIPRGGGARHPKAAGNPWWNERCQSAVAAKSAAFSCWKKSRGRGDPDTTQQLHTAYKQANSRCNKIVAEAKKEYFTSFVSEQVNNPADIGKVWVQVKKMKRTYHLPDPPLTHNSTQYKTNTQKADIFADAFAQASQTSTLPQAEQNRRQKAEKQGEGEISSDDTSPLNHAITMGELRSAVHSIKSVKVATGTDPISYAMIKNFSPLFMTKLLNFFQLCWRSGSIPAEWKRAVVIPIHKQGKPRANVSSYRPISLTPHLGKLYERVLKSRLEHHCESRGIIPLFQAGFRRGRGVTDHIVRLSSHVKKALGRRHSTLAAFYDIHRAYDSVWHFKLIEKLKKIGISGNLLEFVQSYLKDRSFRVRYRGVLSGTRHVDMGVPQGSVIAPLLFSIMLYDINKIDPQGAVMSLYADDLAVWMSVPGRLSAQRNRKMAIAKFQQLTDSIVEFMKDSGFALSPSKTVFVAFTKSQNVLSKLSIVVNDTVIKPSTTVKFLGVIFHYRLAWGPHINYLINKARKKLTLIKVLSGQPWANTGRTLITIVQALIRSVLTYGQEVYHTAASALLHRLETADVRGLKLALGLPAWASVCQTYREAGVMPINHVGRQAAACYSVRARATENSTKNELTEQTRVHSRLKHKETYTTINDYVKPLMEKITVDISQIAQVPLSPYPPWLLEKAEIITSYGQLTKRDAPLLIATRAKEYLYGPLQTHLHIYTDGSVQDDGGVGAAFVIPEFSVGRKYKLTKGVSIFTAELVGILMALTHVGEMPSPPLRIAILSDSKSALMALESSRSKERAEIQHEIKTVIHQLITRGVSVSLAWVPGHTSLRGNDMADRQAKAAAAGEEGSVPVNIKLSAAEAKSAITSLAWGEWQKECAALAKEGKWLDLAQPSRLGFIPPGTIPVKNLVHRLRVGAHVGRFADATPLCACGQSLNPQHVLECHTNKQHFKTLQEKTQALNIPFKLPSLLVWRSDVGWSLAVQTAQLLRAHPLGHWF